MTDLRSPIDDLAARSAARLADIERREQNVQQAESELAIRRRDVDADMRILADRLALVLQAEAALDARTKTAAGEFVTLAAARAAAEAVRQDYEGRVASLRAVLK